MHIFFMFKNVNNFIFKFIFIFNKVRLIVDPHLEWRYFMIFLLLTTWGMMLMGAARLDGNGMQRVGKGARLLIGERRASSDLLKGTETEKKGEEKKRRGGFRGVLRGRDRSLEQKKGRKAATEKEGERPKVRLLSHSFFLLLPLKSFGLRLLCYNISAACSSREIGYRKNYFFFCFPLCVWVIPLNLHFHNLLFSFLHAASLLISIITSIFSCLIPNRIC